MARQQLASELLNPSWVLTQPEALHFWLRLPQPWSRVVLMQHLRSCGIGSEGWFAGLAILNCGASTVISYHGYFHTSRKLERKS
jgi:hypothetical protein